MGTTTGDQCTSDGDGTKLVDFSHWFTWCQTCRHGGHASHMVHWFKYVATVFVIVLFNSYICRQHLECPVTACQCRCFSIDAV